MHLLTLVSIHFGKRYPKLYLASAGMVLLIFGADAAGLSSEPVFSLGALALSPARIAELLTLLIAAAGVYLVKTYPHSELVALIEKATDSDLNADGVIGSAANDIGANAQHE